jgi:hypothetical protein
MQEIFQDGAQNASRVFGCSPMAFLDTRHYGEETGLYPALLRQGERLGFADLLSADEPEQLLECFPPGPRPGTHPGATGVRKRDGCRITTTSRQRSPEMRTYHLHETTTATPAQVLAGLIDFGPGRQQIFGNSRDEYLEIHHLGADSADVTEGTGSGPRAFTWERLAYGWSNPGRVTMDVVDSNVWSSASGHVYSITTQGDGRTAIYVAVTREGKNLKGRLLAYFVSTFGLPSLAEALHETVKAIEMRSEVDVRPRAAA